MRSLTALAVCVLAVALLLAAQRCLDAARLVAASNDRLAASVEGANEELKRFNGEPTGP